LESLRECWSDSAWAEICLRHLECIASRSIPRDGKSVPFGGYPRLRARQRLAFKLPEWKAGFLWGPPGTGKTWTLGRLLASFLLQNRSAKVLLLSTTNNAIDIALVETDRAIKEVEPNEREAPALRKACKRIGNQYVASNYAGRSHLIPAQDPQLLAQLAALEASRPPKENVREYSRWKEAAEKIRSLLRVRALEVLCSSRLAAMTTTRAAFGLEDLRSLGRFDLVVFDEASQVGLAHAAALIPLGTRAVFAGDPRQLAPITRAESILVDKWLGQSVFAHMDESAGYTCMLDEQSRMAPTICKAVSTTFYGGKLRVAKECASNREWLEAHTPVRVRQLGGQVSGYLHMVAQAGEWSQQWHGFTRSASADVVVSIVDMLSPLMSREQILVVTPFRAQRALIRYRLKQNRIRDVAVSTAHRAQGGERHTVIFDPVVGGEEFLQGEAGRRLINVAVSRAMARLVIIASEDDLASNAILRALVAAFEPETRDGTPICQFVHREGFPQNAVGRRVVIEPRNRSRPATVGRVKAVAGEYLVVSRDSGGEARFVVDVLKRLCGERRL
jgi:superfamily I DNA and/or RNA helicase